jgi:hypothetical protein
MRFGSIGGVIVLLWLILGGVAAYERGYFRDTGDASCAEAGTVLVTVVAGPLNWLGVNPKITCDVPKTPQPSISAPPWSRQGRRHPPPGGPADLVRRLSSCGRRRAGAGAGPGAPGPGGSAAGAREQGADAVRAR